MTIVQPHTTTKNFTTLLIVGFVFFALIGAVISILNYNRVVDMRYRLSSLEKTIEKAEAANADLKNTLYTMTDAVNEEEIIQQFDLVQERNPEYVGGKTAQLSAAIQ